MRLLKQNILVTLTETKQETESGIILGPNAETGNKPALVIEKSPKVVTVNVGDVVYIKWPEAFAITYEGKECAIIDEEHVKAVID